MKFEIDRKRWLRGEGPSLSALLRKSDGKMCCLGFKAKALGIADADITDKGHPRSTRNCEQWCDIAGLDRAAVFEKLSDIYNPFMIKFGKELVHL